jgi:hypothetical protein
LGRIALSSSALTADEFFRSLHSTTRSRKENLDASSDLECQKAAYDSIPLQESVLQMVH